MQQSLFYDKKHYLEPFGLGGTVKLGKKEGDGLKGHKVLFIVRSRPLLWQRLKKQICFLESMMLCHRLSQSPASFGLAPQVLIYVQP